MASKPKKKYQIPENSFKKKKRPKPGIYAHNDSGKGKLGKNTVKDFLRGTPKPKKKPAKPKTPAWQDSTYQKQMSYYKKLAGDFGAEETRKKADVGTYYGTLGTADTKKAVTRTINKRVKVPVKKRKVKAKKGHIGYVNDTVGYKYVNKKSTENVYDTKKSFTGKYNTVKKTRIDPKTKKKIAYTVKEPVYKTTKSQRYKVTKGKAATEGLYQKELKDQRSKDTVDIADDYAARGIIHSGLYAQKRGDYEKEYGKQLGEVNRQRSKQYGDIASERRQFNREQELQKENARLDAIRRRAAKTGNIGI